jgi:dual oxidase
LIRLLPADYSDGVYKPSGIDRPNPIYLSEAFMKGEIGEKSATGKTALFVFFGQQVVEEILDAQSAGCPPEYINIEIPKEVYAENGTLVKFSHSTGHTSMPLLRSRYKVITGQSPNNPRQQLNEVTPWIDGGLTYGTSKGWSDTLRSFKNGALSGFLDSNDREFPVYNDIKLPLANPPPPSGPHEWFGNTYPQPKPRLLPVNRFFSKFLILYPLNLLSYLTLTH